MKLTVKNLGAISHAEVDLSKDLILLTGENNTGKTYLAYTIYGLYQLKHKLDWMYHHIPVQKSEKGSINLEKDLYTYIYHLENEIEQQLESIFAAPKEIFKKTKIQLEKSEAVKKFILNDWFDKKFYEDPSQAPEEILKLAGSPTFTYSIYRTDVLNLVKWILANSFFEQQTYIFTAERSGINVFNKELSLIKGRFLSILLKSVRNQGLIDLAKNRINRYSEPIQDELEETSDYDIQQKRKYEFSYLAEELEKNFLRGRVHASDTGDLRFTPNDSNKELEIHTTSSMVKSLSPLVFYLRHKAHKNDFIIIDEPELNLHPDNQRKIARFMGRLIQEGFKVLVSTHSDYIVRELNNLIMLHSGTQQKPEIAQDLLKTHGYAANELLDKERIGVYLFRLGKPVEAVAIDDDGFSVATIDEEVNKLNQTSQDIYFNLFD